MKYYVANRRLYAIPEGAELYHHGVKGMKWGVRNKKELKVAKRFAKAGRYKGEADFQRKLAREAASSHLKDAGVLDRQAKAWDKKGHVIAAEVARRRAQKLKDRAAEARREYDDAAAYYDRKAAKASEKASKYASKKRVDLGKKKVDSILKGAKSEGYKNANNREENRKWLEEN